MAARSEGATTGCGGIRHRRARLRRPVTPPWSRCPSGIRRASRRCGAPDGRAPATPPGLRRRRLPRPGPRLGVRSELPRRRSGAPSPPRWCAVPPTPPPGTPSRAGPNRCRPPFARRCRTSALLPGLHDGRDGGKCAVVARDERLWEFDGQLRQEIFLGRSNADRAHPSLGGSHQDLSQGGVDHAVTHVHTGRALAIRPRRAAQTRCAVLVEGSNRPVARLEHCLGDRDARPQSRPCSVRLLRAGIRRGSHAGQRLEHAPQMARRPAQLSGQLGEVHGSLTILEPAAHVDHRRCRRIDVPVLLRSAASARPEAGGGRLLSSGEERHVRPKRSPCRAARTAVDARGTHAIDEQTVCFRRTQRHRLPTGIGQRTPGDRSDGERCCGVGTRGIGTPDVGAPGIQLVHNTDPRKRAAQRLSATGHRTRPRRRRATSGAPTPPRPAVVGPAGVPSSRSSRRCARRTSSTRRPSQQ